MYNINDESVSTHFVADPNNNKMHPPTTMRIELVDKHNIPWVYIYY